MTTTRKLQHQQPANERNKLPGISIRPPSTASTKSAQQKQKDKYRDPLMESYTAQNKLPSVTRSTASYNSTDFESKKEEAEQLHLPSIDDVKSCHSNEERVMSKEECTKI